MIKEAPNITSQSIIGYAIIRSIPPIPMGVLNEGRPEAARPSSGRIWSRDEEEAVVFLTPIRRLMLSKEETGLWTNSKAVVWSLKALFEELWQDSQPLSKRIEELRAQNI